MNPEFEEYSTLYDNDNTLDSLIQQYTLASLKRRYEEEANPVEVLTEKYKKLEKTINIIIELLPEDIKSSIKVALELDEGENEED